MFRVARAAARSSIPRVPARALNLHEYQSKELMQKYAVAVQVGPYYHSY